MKWDRDIRWLWRVALIALSANIGATIGTAWKRQWATVLICLLWTINVLVWMCVIRKVQNERHREREAMQDLWQKIREQDDTLASLKRGSQSPHLN